MKVIDLLEVKWHKVSIKTKDLIEILMDFWKKHANEDVAKRSTNDLIAYIQGIENGKYTRDVSLWRIEHEFRLYHVNVSENGDSKFLTYERHVYPLSFNEVWRSIYRLAGVKMPGRFGHAVQREEQ